MAQNFWMKPLYVCMHAGRGNQANPAHPCKSAQYHFYRKRQQFSFVYNLKDFTSNSIHLHRHHDNVIIPIHGYNSHEVVVH